MGIRFDPLVYSGFIMDGGSGSGGVPTYPTFADFPDPAVAGNGALAIALDTNILYESTGVVWEPIAAPGDVLTIGAFGSTPNADGLSLTDNELIMQPADATHPGGVSTGTQSFAGDKTFTGAVFAPNSTIDDGAGNAIFGTSASSPDIYAAFVHIEGSGIATIRMQQGFADTYNFNLPSDSGSSDTLLTSGGGGSTPMTWTAKTNLTDSGTDGITIGNGSNAVLGASPVTITQHVADTTHNGYLSSTDWNTFNAKQTSVLTSAHILVGNVSNVATDVAASGDLTLANTGAFTVAKIQTTTVSGTTGTGNVVFNNAPTFAGDVNMNSHKITNVTDPAAAQDAATKSYVDSVVAALNPAEACYAASTTAIAGTYLNGVVGVGATFTTTATGTFTIDGVTPALGARILLKDQSSGFQNGIYTITTLGSIGVSTIFTRALNYNTAAEMNSAGLIPIQNGTTNALSSWQQIAVITTVGTDDLMFSEFTANPSLYLLKANNLSDVASKSTSFNTLSPVTSTGDIIIGNGSNSNTRLAKGTQYQTFQATATTAAYDAVHLDQSAAVTGTLPNANTTATSANTNSAIVARDGSGNFSAGTISAALTGTASGNTTISGQTNHGVVVASTTNAMSSTSAGTAGQALVSGGTSADPSFGAIGSNGVTTTTFIPPTVQIFTSGSSNYTVPSSPRVPLYLKVTAVGGGGAGGGSSTTGGIGTGGNQTTFGTSLLTAGGGGGGPGGSSGGASGGAGGSATINSPAITLKSFSGGTGSGADNNNATNIFLQGGSGGTNALGGGGAAGAAGAAGGAGVTNSGAGGGGAGQGTALGSSGAGGGAGAYIEAIIASPVAAAVYAYSVGGTSAGGAAGTGAAGGGGAAGIIIVEEYYQ